MGIKITRYANIKILPNDGVKFNCKCGCNFVAFGKDILVDCDCLGGDTEFYYSHCPECQKCCISDSNNLIHNYWNNENPNDNRPRISHNYKRHLEIFRMLKN